MEQVGTSESLIGNLENEPGKKPGNKPGNKPGKKPGKNPGSVLASGDRNPRFLGRALGRRK